MTNDVVDMATLTIDPEEVKLGKFELPAEAEPEESREKQLGLVDLGPDAPRSMRRGPDEADEFAEPEVPAEDPLAEAPAVKPAPTGGEES
jgi:hypothetical protein